MGSAGAIIGAVGSGLNVVGNVASGFISAEQIKAQGAIDQSNARMRAASARFAAKQAKRAAEKRIGILVSRKAQRTGKQRVAVAGQGIDTRSGTAASEIIQSRFFSDLDVIETKNNATLQMFGFESEALSADFAVELSKIATETGVEQSRFSSIAGGGIAAAKGTGNFLNNRRADKNAGAQQSMLDWYKSKGSDTGRRG